MKTKALQKLVGSTALGLMLAASLLAPHAARAEVVDLATSPLANATTTNVRPNLMFILDDSGSMNWDYMPDLVVDSNYCKGSGTGTSLRCCRTAGGTSLSSSTRTSTCLPSSSATDLRGMPPFYSADFNKIYYDPTVTYSPPFNHDATERTSYTGTSSVPLDGYNIQTTASLNLLSNYPDVEWCTDSTHTDCLRNGDYLLPGVVGGKSYTTMRATTASGTSTFAVGTVDAPATETRTAGPFYYVMVPGEYCTNNDLTSCIAATGPTGTHPVPAKLRWCRNVDRTDCRATQNSTYNYPRYPTIITNAGAGATASTATFSISGVGRSNGSGSGTDNECNGRTNVVTVTSIRVTGVDLLPASFRYCNSNNNDTTRNRGLAEEIASRIGNGFSGSRSGTNVTVTAPDGSYNSQSLTYNVTAASLSGATFSGGAPASPPVFVPGAFTRIDIVSGATYGNIVVDGTVVVDRSRRTDCAAAPSCTYTEELRNFANWFAWYRTRMQSMKTSVSRAFVTIDSTYRVGFRSLNNNSSVNLKIDNFNPGSDGHKDKWYKSLFKAYPNSGTPLRQALADVGRIYAGKLDSTNDPVQYSCQQNFALLTSDGYWNGSAGTDVAGGSIGNQDGAGTLRPYYEGPTASSGSLADIAKYYYETDLRTVELSNCSRSGSDEDLCKNNVFTSGDDNNPKQHMTTFTLGLGVDGELRYRSDYKTATSGDYWNILNGLGTPQANWPVPAADTARAVDDMWHAAVNGRGTYFSAGNPTELSNGLRSALTEIRVKIGAGAAAATSTLSPVAGDNFAYVASYTTVKWTGNLEAREINLTTGAVGLEPLHCVENVSSEFGSCTGTMATKVGAASDTRDIYTSSGSGLVSFTYDNLSEAQRSYFNPSTLSQWGDLTETQRAQATGINLVNYLRGQHGFEMRTDNAVDNQVFRRRDAVLGDLVESTPNYVGRPKFSYTDPGYEAFKTANAGRGGTIYVGSNDGMLHAFDAADLTERWAFIPSIVIPSLSLLADQNYGTLHRYYVNGSPVVSDICTSNCTDAASAVWKTVLIGGLNGGGRGYYALDVTNPTSPALLWEFTLEDDDDLGFSFGNPVVTKLEGGQWVVALTSGYNNVGGTNAGEGFLYVLDAWTGAVVRKIGTGVGSSTNPSGLSRIAVWVDDLSRNNTAGYTYGGDLLGNVWRFDLNNGEEAGVNPLKFATLFSDAAATEPQPITTRPELGRLNGKRMVFVGTGKYLEVGDLSDDQVQSLYAIKDNDETTTLVNPRTSLVQQGFTETDEATRVGTSNPVPSSARGWYIDLPDDGERQNVASELVSGVLIVPTTVPTTTACEPGGYSWLNFVDYRTGGEVPTWSRVSRRFSAPIVGINIVYIDGKPRVSVVKADNPTPEIVDTEEFPGGGAAFQSKRAVWREVIQ
ncbi:pilus assembly protein [Thauera humireducens]|nr:PilC/PilY family type IV pilus protein [Thauera humireducens]